MIYDINQMLGKGAEFPPRSEIARLDGYKVNALLLEGEAWSVLSPYQERVNAVLANFSLPANFFYYYDANNWADLVEKYQELCFGEPPEVSISEETTSDNRKKTLTELFTQSKFFQKAKAGCSDFIALGDWVTKIVKVGAYMTYISVDPSTWFPIVSRENVEEVKAHVFAWIVDIDDKRKELHVQIHERGKYTNRAFEVKNYQSHTSYKDEVTGQEIEHYSCTIGEELEESRTTFKLGTEANGVGENEFAVVFSANNPRPRKIYGTSDFERITSAAMEYNVRMTLKNAVLDKHSAPKMYGPELEKQDDDDDSVAVMGNYIEVSPDSSVPGFLTWDASMTAVENSITGVKDDIANLSGMGALLNSKTFGESQGYDALMIKLSPAFMRSKGKKDTLGEHLKKLISLLSKSYGEIIPVRDISIQWHDGIPQTESVRADIATKHLASGWTQKRVLVQDYGFTEDDAVEEVEQKRLEQPSFPAFGIDPSGGGGGDDS